MKSIIFSITFLFVTQFVIAQDFEGMIRYSIEYMDYPEDQEEAIEAGIMSDQISLKAWGPYFRSDQNGVAGLSVIVDGKKGKTTILIHAGESGQKMEIPGTDVGVNVADEGYEIEYTDETKTIHGYQCYLAVIVYEDGTEYEVWYTEELSFAEGRSAVDYADVKGVPLQYTIKKGEFVMAFNVVEIRKGVYTKKDFKSPKGYQTLKT